MSLIHLCLSPCYYASMNLYAEVQSQNWDYQFRESWILISLQLLIAKGNLDRLVDWSLSKSQVAEASILFSLRYKPRLSRDWWMVIQNRMNVVLCIITFLYIHRHFFCGRLKNKSHLFHVQINTDCQANAYFHVIPI